MDNLFNWLNPVTLFSKACNQDLIHQHAHLDMGDPKISEQYQLLALRSAGLLSIEPDTTHRAGAPTAPATTTANTGNHQPDLLWANRLMENMTMIHELVLNTTKALFAHKKCKNLFENLPVVRLIIIRASALSHSQEVEPVEPYLKCSNLFNTSSRANASLAMQAMLREMHQHGKFQTGHLTALPHQGIL
jgi:hypothetical protein